ncbi:SMEK domain-containing protein [Leisingera sp. M527]|uniref:SMEK domain-containing protein n=1 Tax=Leisingera sp. M527 TaxID=2867014 RepID=UPI0021A2DDA7|nr:SMEK domain-containing protein [Leisingera sp. M527]UWQ32173.1 SMEK domain-containing protein [Leisingera sp. M527]
MTRQELLQKSASLLGRFAYEVRVSNAQDLFDINTVAEDLLVPIFATILDCPNLQNQNRIQMNFPAVDLGCKVGRISIQVTSDASSSKINETLEKFKSHGLDADFDRVLVYVLTERQQSYNSKALAATVTGLPIEFSTSRDILDFHSLAKLIGELSNERIQRVCDLLEGEFKKADANAKFRSELDAFLSASGQKIEDEKRTKKYIPSVFVETSGPKEQMRFFAHPMFFYRKIDDELRRFNLEEFNKLLRMAKIDEVQGDLKALANLPSPENLNELRNRLATQLEEISSLKDQVSVFSWYGERAERYVPKDYLTGYWTVFEHNVESNGSGVYRSLGEITDQINLALAKIFLVTGMAGQGKTNFVCDLVENQFRKFEIPAVFIPARKLNDFPGPNRIKDYITNNRFAPELRNIHDLLDLFDNVAKDFGKPFIIAIDGINEVGDLDGFVSELRVFLDALCQYDFVKVVITCRNEFFDHKFAGLFEPQFAEYLHRVHDLRNEMTDDNKDRLLHSYLDHFRICVSLSRSAKEFLENDLILLRIFCDIHEGKNIGYVPEIYKGDIFEGYLTLKIGEFPVSDRRKALSSIYKICEGMLENEDFSQLPLEGFDDGEMAIVEKLIGEDIILRREVPATGLLSLGVENISFTYDEMRDFLLAHFAVVELAPSDPPKINELFEAACDWPIYEGFFRYAYVLARKHGCNKVIEVCEASDDFDRHYLNNLTLLSADIQTSDDVARVKAMLSSLKVERELRHLSWFLFRKREASDHLNVMILLDHLDDLDDGSLQKFVKAMFSRSGDYRGSEWKDRTSHLLQSLLELDDDQQIEIGSPALAVALYITPFAHWDEREAIKNLFSNRAMAHEFHAAIKLGQQARSDLVQACIAEITDEQAVT